MTALQLGTHLTNDGGWNRIQQLWNVIELFSTGARVSLAVLSAGGRATQPHDGRLIVAYLSDWTPEVSGLARELVQRQREEGWDVLLRYPINTTIPLPPSHVEGVLHLVYGTLDGRVADAPSRTPRFWRAATTSALADRLSKCVQQKASVSQALISFLQLEGNFED